MIATLSGRLRVREPGRIVVETGGVGYEVIVPLSTYYRLPRRDDEVTLDIRQVVREDSITLYGFGDGAEKQAFDLLMQVQHVGPKLALAILSVLSPEDLVTAIAREDIERIDAVPGVGPKVAERVVRELREKAAALRFAAPAASAMPGVEANGADAHDLLDDAVSALVNLDYKPHQARRAVEAVAATIQNEENALDVLIRKSLAVLLGER